MGWNGGNGNNGWFAGVKDPQQLKRMYHELALRWHPDREGGNLETMKQVNLAYEQALKASDGYTVKGEDGKDHTYHYNQDLEREIMSKISDIISARIRGISLELVGSWLWVEGETRPNKETLKKLHFLWHSTRQKWYWRASGQKFYRKSGRFNDFDNLRNAYGSRAISLEETTLV